MTFYSVVYRVWGADRTYEKWFDNKTEAEAFASRDYADKPKAHRYTNHKAIAEAQKRVFESGNIF